MTSIDGWRQEPTADDVRALGSLKWTGMPADVAAWVAESDLGTPPVVRDALHAAVDQGLLGYLPPAVRRRLGEAVARWYGERWDLPVPAEAVVPVGDVREALRLTVELCSRPGSPLVVPTPTYMPFLTAPELWGREVLQVPMRVTDEGTTPDLDALGAAFRAGGHLLVLINPHNPTGRVLRVDELRAVADVVERHDGVVFADEVHAPLVHPGHRHVPYAAVSPAAAEHTVTATSASKAWNVAGLKCAQVVLTSTSLADRWHPVDEHVSAGAGTLGAVANATAWADGGPWLDDVALPYLDANRRAFAETLARVAPDVGHRPPEGTYLAWLDLRAVLDRLDGLDGLDGLPDWRTAPVGALARWLHRRSGVAVTDGAACGEAGRGHVRVNLALPRGLVTQAAERLGHAVQR